jgi:hypothetical protein
MTTFEAYEYTLEQINKLSKHGITIEINESQSQCNIIKHGVPELHFRLWKKVLLKELNKFQMGIVGDILKYLAMVGITFDSGLCCGSKDDLMCVELELDWSFNSTGRVDADRIDAIEELLGGDIDED